MNKDFVRKIRVISLLGCQYSMLKDTNYGNLSGGMFLRLSHIMRSLPLHLDSSSPFVLEIQLEGWFPVVHYGLGGMERIANRCCRPGSPPLGPTHKQLAFWAQAQTPTWQPFFCGEGRSQRRLSSWDIGVVRSDHCCWFGLPRGLGEGDLLMHLPPRVRRLDTVALLLTSHRGVLTKRTKSVPLCCLLTDRYWTTWLAEYLPSITWGSVL